MARIRTIKPEAFFSESLAEVSVEAERTFFGLLTQADDHGRHRDNAAIIAGLLWPLRAEHTSVHVEDDLHQLANSRPDLPVHRLRRPPLPPRRDLVRAPEDRQAEPVPTALLPAAPGCRQVRTVQGRLHPADRGLVHHYPRTRRDFGEGSPSPRSACHAHLDDAGPRRRARSRPAGGCRRSNQRPRAGWSQERRSEGVLRGLPEPSPKPPRRLGAWI